MKDILKAKIGDSVLFNAAKFKDEFSGLAKEVISTNNTEALRGYFEHTAVKPLHSLFVRKMVESVLETNDTEREVCSQLLAFCKHVLGFGASAYSYAFDELLYVLSHELIMPS